MLERCFLLCSGDGIYLDGFGFRVQSTLDGNLFAGELFRGLLIAEGVDFFAVEENVAGVVDLHAGNGALGVVRSHLHAGMIATGAHAIGDDAAEGMLVGRDGEEDRRDQTEQEGFHDRTHSPL